MNAYWLTIIFGFLPNGQGSDPASDKVVMVQIDEKHLSIHSCMDAFLTHRRIMELRAGHKGVAVVGNPCQGRTFLESK